MRDMTSEGEFGCNWTKETDIQVAILNMIQNQEPVKETSRHQPDILDTEAKDCQMFL